MTAQRPNAFTFLLALVALLLATLSPTVYAEDACPTLKYVVRPNGNGRKTWAGQMAKISFSLKNKSPITLDNYVVRMAIPIDKVTFTSYNVYDTTARHKATTTFAREPDGSLIAWTIYNMPAGDTFRIVVYVEVRGCAALGPAAFSISSYQDIDGFPACPVLGPAGMLRIITPKKSKKEGRPAYGMSYARSFSRAETGSFSCADPVPELSSYSSPELGLLQQGGASTSGRRGLEGRG